MFFEEGNSEEGVSALGIYVMLFKRGMELLSHLKDKFCKMAPNWLFALIAPLYFGSHPQRCMVLCLPVNGFWLVIRQGGLKFLLPSPKDGFLVSDRTYECFLNLEEGDIVLDVGACFGSFTLSAAKKVGNEGCVIAIEPEPKNMSYLRTNINLNNIRNVHTVEKAAWNHEDVLELQLSDGISGHSLSNFESDRIVKVKTDTLDNIISNLVINKIVCMKMDVEGAELIALEGAKEVLGMCRKIVIETHPLRGIWTESVIKTTTRGVHRLLESRGFMVSGGPRMIFAWKNDAPVSIPTEKPTVCI